MEGEGCRIREGIPRRVTPDLGFLHGKKRKRKRYCCFNYCPGEYPNAVLEYNVFELSLTLSSRESFRSFVSIVLEEATPLLPA